MSYNTAQIIDRGREAGQNVSDAQAQQIMNDTGGGDEGAVLAYFRGGGSSGGDGGFKPLSATDVADVAKTVANNPKLIAYYTQLAKEAQGDFDRAVSIMKEDYVKGVRDQKIQYAFSRDQQLKELNNTLNQLGISNFQDQRDTIDDLNKRGMAVYQNNTDGASNVLKTSDINSNTDFNATDNFNNTSTIQNPQNPQMGEGGFELAQLQRKQQLQQEAQQRAATKPIEQAGIQLKQYTNLPAGINPNLPPDQLVTALAASGVDRSSLGSAEQGLVRGKEQETRQLQQTQEDLSNQRASDVSNISGQIAASGSKAGAEQLANQVFQNKQNTFVSTGTT